MNDLEGKIQQLKEKICLNPDEPLNYKELGNIYFELNDLEEAKNNYCKALDIDSGYYLACHNLGLVYAKMGHFEIAIDYFKRALAINKDYLPASEVLGGIYAKLEMYLEARKVFEDALKVNPLLLDFKLNLVKVMIKLGEYESAKEILDGLVIEETSTQACVLMADILAKIGKTEEAIDTLKAFYSVGERCTDFDFALGKLYFVQKKYDLTITHLEKCLDMDYLDYEFYYCYSIALDLSGRQEDAIKYYNQILKIQPDAVHALYRIGLDHQMKGEFKASLECFQEIVSLNFDDQLTVKSLYALGYSYRCLKEYSVAVTHYEASLRLNYNQKECCEALSTLYKILGNIELSNEFFEKMKIFS